MNERERYLKQLVDHREDVQSLLNSLAHQLIERGRIHDKSKFSDPELEGFSKNIDMVKDIKYGTEEHINNKRKLQSVIDTHHKNNQHHPEHWNRGIEDMSILDILEMMVDWKCASKKYKHGNFKDSLEVNSKLYGISDQLKSVMENTFNRHFNE